MAAEYLLDILSKVGRTALPFMLRGVTEELSANAILNQLSAAGLGIRRQTGLEVIAQLRGYATGGRFLELLKETQIPAPEGHAVAIGRLTKNFSYGVEITGTNPVTGERETRHVTVMSSQPLPRTEIFGEVDSMLSDQERYSPIADAEFNVSRALRDASVVIP